MRTILLFLCDIKSRKHLKMRKECCYCDVTKCEKPAETAPEKKRMLQERPANKITPHVTNLDDAKSSQVLRTFPPEILSRISLQYPASPQWLDSVSDAVQPLGRDVCVWPYDDVSLICLPFRYVVKKSLTDYPIWKHNLDSCNRMISNWTKANLQIISDCAWHLEQMES